MSSEHSKPFRVVRWNWLGGLAALVLGTASASAQVAPPGAEPPAAVPASNSAAPGEAPRFTNGLRPTPAALPAAAEDPSRGLPADAEREIQKARAEVQKLRAEVEMARRQLAELERALAQQRQPNAGDVASQPKGVPNAAQPNPFEARPGSWMVAPVPVAPGMSPAPSVPGNFSAAPMLPGMSAPVAGARVAPRTREQRLDMLERQVEAMLAEVRSLRSEVKPDLRTAPDIDPTAPPTPERPTRQWLQAR